MLLLWWWWGITIIFMNVTVLLLCQRSKDLLKKGVGQTVTVAVLLVEQLLCTYEKWVVDLYFNPCMHVLLIKNSIFTMIKQNFKIQSEKKNRKIFTCPANRIIKNSNSNKKTHYEFWMFHLGYKRIHSSWLADEWICPALKIVSEVNDFPFEGW